MLDMLVVVRMIVDGQRMLRVQVLRHGVIVAIRREAAHLVNQVHVAPVGVHLQIPMARTVPLPHQDAHHAEQDERDEEIQRQ